MKKHALGARVLGLGILALLGCGLAWHGPGTASAFTGAPAILLTYDDHGTTSGPAPGMSSSGPANGSTKMKRHGSKSGPNHHRRGHSAGTSTSGSTTQ